MPEQTRSGFFEKVWGPGLIQPRCVWAQVMMEPRCDGSEVPFVVRESQSAALQVVQYSLYFGERVLGDFVMRFGGVQRCGFDADFFDPASVVSKLVGKAANVLDEGRPIRVQELMQFRGTAYADAARDPSIVGSLQSLMEASIDFFEQLLQAIVARSIDFDVLPSHHVQGFELSLAATLLVNGDQQAAFGAGLSDMSALDVAREGDEGAFAQNLALVDMPQSPIVVIVPTQVLDRAGSIV
jgi:hypothetical protein